MSDPDPEGVIPSPVLPPSHLEDQSPISVPPVAVVLPVSEGWSQIHSGGGGAAAKQQKGTNNKGVTTKKKSHHSVRFFNAPENNDSGPTGAGGEGNRSKKSSNASWFSPTRNQRSTLQRRQSQGRPGDDGDQGDFGRFLAFINQCRTSGGNCIRGWDPMSRRLIREAVAPWTRRFSDVQDHGPSEAEGSTTVSAGDAEVGPTTRPSRASTVEDVRRQYVFGNLPSFGGEDASDSAELEIIRKEDFLMKLAVALQSYGCPIPRIEYSMEILLKTLGVDGSFSVLPALIFVSFGLPISASSETHIIRVGGGLDVYRLRKVNHLVNRIAAHQVTSLPEAITKLDSIIQEPVLFSWQIKLAAYALASGAVAPLFFKGSLLDGLLSGIIGIMAGGLWVLSDSSYILGKIGLIASSFCSSVFGTLLSLLVKGRGCSFALHFGPITYLLPGWSITCSVIELSTQNSISGTTRMFTSFMNLLLIGFGLDLGHRCVFWVEDDWASTDTCQPVSTLTKIPLFFITTTCFHILMKAAPAQWLGMTIVDIISFTTITWSSSIMNPSNASVLTAFIIGVAGNLYSYATNSPALIPILSGVFLIVPGSMGVKGVHAMVNGDTNVGLEFGFRMMVIAISIAMGLFAASVLMYKHKVKISNAVFF